ncbi:hypothetical protein LTR08_008443 [Meristemomyces frigidus]|nr:hypothetical protein LTR08_008443 [Meristemomyces frigidus]
MSAPTIPPRPSGASTVKQESLLQKPPQVPARPIRKTDPSPSRDSYTRSPLNFAANAQNGHASSAFAAPGEKPSRPPSISLPADAGSEGMEYTSYDQLPSDGHGAASNAADGLAQTRNVAAELPLHAPKASIPQSAATNRISTVTRTDSTQAAAAGIGKARPDDDVHKYPTDSGASLSRVTSRTYDDLLRRVPSTDPQYSRASASAGYGRSGSGLHNRPSSVQSDHEGIPEIGMQIPLYKNAGDVQAPSPAPTQPQFTQGIGFFNDGTSRAHHRKRSSRHEFGPPDSYGMHGHGRLEPADQFERDWLLKHPHEAAKEGYGPYVKPQSALSVEQLNKLVQENIDIGMGTSRDAIGTPTQDIAFVATEQFASRMNTPKSSPMPTGEPKKHPSSGQQPALSSGLRKESFPFTDPNRRQQEQAAESESEADDVIHIDPPHRRGDKVNGGGAMDNTVDLGPSGGNTEDAGGWYDERGEGTPILASDETDKRPGSAFLQPAVSPEETRVVDDSYYDSDSYVTSRRGSAPPSRPSSRPGSMHGYLGGPLHRFISHEETRDSSGMGTPLEEIEEYEPLFPEGEEEKREPKQAPKQRPGLEHHHFPSQDIWEDSPSSLQYQTTVDQPESPDEHSTEKVANAESNSALVFETPELEEERRTQNPADMTTDGKTFAKPHFKAGVLEELRGERPGVQRFPSRDIWEDTPDSMRLETTVSGPQSEIFSPTDDDAGAAGEPLRQDEMKAKGMMMPARIASPSIPARPDRKSKLAQEMKPEVPERPSQQDDVREREVPDLGASQPQMLDRTKPTLPNRSKPTVPARPARASHSDQSEGAGAPLAKSTSVGSETVTSPPVPKTKPAVPARPAGSKIAALQSGFMNVLNDRLKLGPQGPPKAKELEEEADTAAATPKEPLADARKSRAKGPARRKPAAAAGADDGFGFSMSTPMTLWQIDEKDDLSVPTAEAPVVETSAAEPSSAEASTAGAEEPLAELEKAMSANEARNTQEPTMSVRSGSMSESPTEAKKTFSPPTVAVSGPPASVALPEGSQDHQSVVSGLEAALAKAEPAPVSAESVEAQKEHETLSSSAAQADQTGTLEGGGVLVQEPKDAHEDAGIVHE